MRSNTLLKVKDDEETWPIRVIPGPSVVMTTSVTWSGRMKVNDRHLVAISLIPRWFPAPTGTMAHYFKQWQSSNWNKLKPNELGCLVTSLHKLLTATCPHFGKKKLAKYPSRTRQGVAKQTGYCWIWPADDLLISWDKVWRSTYLRYHRSVVLRHTHMTSKHVFNYTHLDCVLHHLNVIICLLSTIRRLFFVRTNHVTAKPRRAIFVFVCVIFSLLIFKLINET